MIAYQMHILTEDGVTTCDAVGQSRDHIARQSLSRGHVPVNPNGTIIVPTDNNGGNQK